MCDTTPGRIVVGVRNAVPVHIVSGVRGAAPGRIVQMVPSRIVVGVHSPAVLLLANAEQYPSRPAVSLLVYAPLRPAVLLLVWPGKGDVQVDHGTACLRVRVFLLVVAANCRGVLSQG